MVSKLGWLWFLLFLFFSHIRFKKVEFCSYYGSRPTGLVKHDKLLERDRERESWGGEVKDKVLIEFPFL